MRDRIIPLPAQIGFAVLPAVFGYVFFQSFNPEGLAREIEAALAVCVAIGVHVLVCWSVSAIYRQESTAEQMLRDAGTTPDGEALRAAEAVDRARASLDRMASAASGRADALKTAVAEFREVVEPLLDDMLVDAAMRQRADVLLRRTLPRLQDALETYTAYAERGTTMVDPAKLRQRVISALSEAGQQATAARMAGLENTGSEVEIALEIVEDSFSFDRR